MIKFYVINFYHYKFYINIKFYNYKIYTLIKFFIEYMLILKVEIPRVALA